MPGKARGTWRGFARRHPGAARFLAFYMVSNAVTVLQLVLLPVLRACFDHTGLVHVDFRAWPVGAQPDGSPYFVFDYAAGALPSGGGGLAYFLAVQVTILIAQVVNFFAQRNIAFKSNSSILNAAVWYTIAYVAITLLASIAQGFYKAPLYAFLTGGWGAAGQAAADVVTMLINTTISFWVFYPIFTLIFRQKPRPETVTA